MTPLDHQLLAEFAKNHSESAFGTLSERYLGLILNTARRRTGNQSLAEDTAQRVLCILAKKAASLSKQERSLGPWLHRTTLYEASKVMRSESSYQKKKTLLKAELNASQTNVEPQHLDALPHLDQALNHLSAADREILLLHYFEGLTFEQISTQVGRTLAATQKRSQRALQKIASILQRKGVTLSLTALASLLGSEFSQAASPALVKTLTTQSLSSTSSNLPFLNLSPQLLCALASIAVTIPILHQEQKISLTKKQLSATSPATSTPTKSSTLRGSRQNQGTILSTTKLSQLDPFALARAYHAAQKKNNIGIYEIESYLENLSEEELHKILLACTSPDLPPIYQDPFLYALVRESFRKNPLRTCQTLVDLAQETPPLDHIGYIDNEIENWTAQNPDQATRWLQEQLELQTLGSLTHSFSRAGRIVTRQLTQLIKDRPNAVFDYLTQIPESARAEIIGRAFNESYYNHSKNTVSLDKVEYGLALADLLPSEGRHSILFPLATRAFYENKNPTAGLENLISHSSLKEGDLQHIFQSGAANLTNQLNPNSSQIPAQVLQDFETWLFQETANASSLIANALGSSAKRPTDPEVQHWKDRQPLVIAEYLQHQHSQSYLVESDESLEEAFLLAESIPESDARDQTFLHLQTLQETKKTPTR